MKSPKKPKQQSIQSHLTSPRKLKLRIPCPSARPHVPISMLPAELLARILIEAVATHSSVPTESTWDTRVNLTTVCKTWRLVALDHPAFWVGAPLKAGCAGLLEMLPRWKGYPRRVSITLPPWLPDEGLPPLLPNTLVEDLPLLFIPGRVADLQVQDEVSRQSFSLWAALPEGWNSGLHTLSFLGVSNGPSSEWVTATIPANILVSTVGLLQRLTLESCRVDWEALGASGSDIKTAFRNLHTLELNNMKPPPLPTVINLIISSSRRLEVVRIMGCFPSHLEFTLHFPRPSSLVELHLEGGVEAMIDTFSQLFSASTSDLDSLQSLQLHANWSYSGGLELAEELIGRFSAFLNTLQGLPNKRLVITHSSEYCAYQLGDPDAIVVPYGGELDYSLWVSGGRPEDLIPGTRHRYNVPGVGALRLEVDSPSTIPTETWDIFFRGYCNVETLQLDGAMCSQEMMDTIFSLLTLPKDLLHDTVLLPKLRRLSLDYGARDLCLSSGAMETMLQLRWDSGFPIAVVEFDGYEDVALMLSMLREQFPTEVTQFVHTAGPEFSDDSDSESDSDDSWESDESDSQGYSE